MGNREQIRTQLEALIRQERDALDALLSEGTPATKVEAVQALTAPRLAKSREYTVAED